MIQCKSNILLYSTTGASMFPFIRWNEQILVKRTDLEKIGMGDVILFPSDKWLKVCFYDTPVSQEKILGKVIAIKRKLQIIELYTKGCKALVYKFDCLFACGVFLIN